MGAPKQKWTAEEEAALKAGVVKYGAGKWRTILTDPDFSTILRMRSNVDLKDKWRNINVTAIWGSRQKAKLALKKNLPPPKTENNNHTTSTAIVQYNPEVAAPKTLAVSGGISTSKEQISRLDNLILESIVKLKEPKGSDMAAIAAYIEDQYRSPPNLMKLLSTKLKHMVASGKLVKVNHKYRIATNSTKTSEKRKSSSLLLLEGRPKDSPKAEKTDVNVLSQSQIDVELLKMRGVTSQEVAAAAAKAVAEAEAAIAVAEAAAREAETAEAEAEAARVFAKAAMKALKCRRLNIWWRIGDDSNIKVMGEPLLRVEDGCWVAAPRCQGKKVNRWLQGEWQFCYGLYGNVWKNNKSSTQQIGMQAAHMWNKWAMVQGILEGHQTHEQQQNTQTQRKEQHQMQGQQQFSNAQ